MRICHSADFHGRGTLYDQLEALLRQEKPDLVILGGDMLPDGDDDDPAHTQAMFVRNQLGPWIERWKRTVPGLAVACVMGNHDWLYTETAVRAEQDASRLTLLEPQRAWSYKGVSFVGCSYSPPTPHWVKDYERLDVAGDRLPEAGGSVWDNSTESIRRVSPDEHFGHGPTLADELEAALHPADPWILVAHSPPHDTKLDRLPNLDYPIGSKAVRRFIAARRPLCALHGHVHESPEATGAYFDEVGGVLCVNPGQTHERLYAVLFDTNNPRATLRHTVLG